MEKGIIPLRHGSLPGGIRLPKRYEQLCNRKGNKSSSLKRADYVHVQPSARDEIESTCLTERLDDLMQAIVWVKQELSSHISLSIHALRTTFNNNKNNLLVFVVP
ncbi:hypothetical protein ACJMK2_041725 [Sinanodonta woodiana]|uniref:Uncharacterized protein n=1 Tax=Sinanodonta woodiana TaxID=1069815 RepID=A0ABD3W620_SINWO